VSTGRLDREINRENVRYFLYIFFLNKINSFDDIGRGTGTIDPTAYKSRHHGNL
jgi:hypothetical protein